MRISGAAWFSLAIAVLGGAAAAYAATWPLKAALFPMVLGIPLCLLGLVQLARELRGITEPQEEPLPPQSGRRTAAVFAWMAVFIVLVLFAGFPPAVPVFVLAYLLLHRVASVPLAIVLSVATWGAFHLLFERLLHIPFETGLIQDWLGF